MRDRWNHLEHIQPTGVAARDIAVVGSGIAGMAAAWLLGKRHRVTLFEAAPRLGGHTNTVFVPMPGGPLPVDTGFIVYNERNYPNLTALFERLGVRTRAADMSFGVSLDGGALEYAGTDLHGLFAQKRNLLRPRFWSMLADLRRFYRDAPVSARENPDSLQPLGDWLDARGYGQAFRQDHLLPMVAAIWSTPAHLTQCYPVGAFLRFCDNHGLLQLNDRPQWRTVTAGSQDYITRLTADFDGDIRLGHPIARIERSPSHVILRGKDGSEHRFDDVVLATHADQALALLDRPGSDEAALLGAFRSTSNLAVLHTDARLMPRRRAAWASWNYMGRSARPGDAPCVTYWMDHLQGLGSDKPLFVTLNPATPPDPATVLYSTTYEHPMFDSAVMRAQRRLWSLQGVNRTWFCGAWFGAGFHEDGLQAGLAVAEQLGGVRRPWTVANESGRIWITEPLPTLEAAA